MLPCLRLRPLFQETFCLSKVSRTIRIGCVDNAPYSIFPGILHFILARAPGIQLKFEELKGNKFEKVQRSELDFFISPIVKSLPQVLRALIYLKMNIVYWHVLITLWRVLGKR